MPTIINFQDNQKGELRIAKINMKCNQNIKPKSLFSFMNKLYLIEPLGLSIRNVDCGVF